jgi:hypothetical protein
MATWSLCGRHAGPDKPPTPVFINLDNVLTVERQGDLTTVVMVGGEKVYIDTMPQTLIALSLPRGLCSLHALSRRAARRRNHFLGVSRRSELSCWQ